jgi:thiamine kinase-like enzyme
MSEHGETAARAALERVLAADVVSRATLHELEGGVKKRSYLVSAGDRRWVLRLPAPGAEALLDLDTEARVMRAAAAAGLAPEVAAVNAAAGVLLTEYLGSARAWTASDARDPRNIKRAAALLRKLHALEAHAPAFAAESIARGYVAELSAGAYVGRTRFDASEQAWVDELLERTRGYDAAYPPTALCHNDLVAANVLDDGRLMLVDFEYAVRSSPVLDLASLAAMNDYGARERRDLLAAYCAADGGVRIAEAELERIVRLVRLIGFFWARLGELRVGASTAYRTLAAELAERLK